MLKEFNWVAPRTLEMAKKLFSESEISLARCLNLTVDIDRMVVTANLETTAKRALFEFIQESFRAFSHNLDATSYRKEFYKDLQIKYDEIYNEFYTQVLIKAPYHEKLMDHQKHGLATMAHKQYNLLAYEQGLGKTLTSATLSKIYNYKRTVVICPKIVTMNWFRDLTSWGYNELYFSIFDANKYRCIRAFQERWVIINYEQVSNFFNELTKEPIQHIIIDECQNIKNFNSLRSKNILRLIEANPSARVTLMSGTPIKNRVNDFFAYLKLTKHELGNNYAKFLRDFTNSKSGRGGQLQVGSGRNLGDLFKKTSNFMIRRTKEECLDLPPKIIYKYRFELDDYRQQYLDIIKELAERKDVSNLNSCIHSLNIVLAKAKINGIIEMANGILEQDRKVIIFSGYNEPLDMLEKYFGKVCVRIDGSVSAQNRDQRIQQFLTDQATTVFIANMAAGGVGINLVNCSDVIFTNFPFTPAELYQAEDRTHRIGQTKSVNIYYTICSDSIDEYLYELIVEKATDINNLIDKGKEVVDMGSVPERLFKHLIEEYERNNGKTEERSEHTHSTVGVI